LKARKFSANNKKNKMITGAAVVILIGCSLLGYSYVTTKESNNQVLGSSTSVSETPSEIQKVLVAARDVEAGTLVNGDIFKFIEIDTATSPIPIDAVQDLEQLKDKRIKVSIKENEILQSNKLIPKNAWYEEGDRLVEINFVEGAIPTVISRDQLLGSLVDIKLFKKGAEDPTVISKVAIVASDGNKLGFYLNHEETENLKEASTEADGLYIVLYIDDSQIESPVTYEPSYK
jgi:hypothetical protein